jgi:hypothetical protein
MPVISIITRTHGRQKILERQHGIVAAQSEQDFVWLIPGGSPESSSYCTGLIDPRIRYRHPGGGRMTAMAVAGFSAAKAVCAFGAGAVDTANKRKTPASFPAGVFVELCWRASKALQFLADLAAFYSPAA